MLIKKFQKSINLSISLRINIQKITQKNFSIEKNQTKINNNNAINNTNSNKKFPSSESLKNWRPNIPKHKISINLNSHKFPHPIWDLKSAEKINITHKKPKTKKDKLALLLTKTFRTIYDNLSGYNPGKMNESQYLRRCIFLETFAGVPGFIAGIIRHLQSLRYLKADGGWIHHLLEEAENERMHLFTWLSIRKPGILLRFSIILGQLVFLSGYSLMYIISPTLAHRFIGYLEEEAIKTYTQLLKDLDEGKLPEWEKMKASEEAIKYWNLNKNAKFRDVVLSIRADECSHREFNHYFADCPKDMKISGHKLEILEKEGKDLFDNIENEKGQINNKIECENLEKGNEIDLDLGKIKGFKVNENYKEKYKI